MKRSIIIWIYLALLAFISSPVGAQIIDFEYTYDEYAESDGHETVTITILSDSNLSTFDSLLFIRDTSNLLIYPQIAITKDNNGYFADSIFTIIYHDTSTSWPHVARLIAVKDTNRYIVEKQINADFNVYIPNAFNVSSLEEENQLFKVKGTGIETFSLKVFDRTGSKVFETPDLSVGWDGTSNGSTLETGVYIYEVKAKSYRHKEFYKIGTVTYFR